MEADIPNTPRGEGLEGLSILFLRFDNVQEERGRGPSRLSILFLRFQDYDALVVSGHVDYFQFSF